MLKLIIHCLFFSVTACSPNDRGIDGRVVSHVNGIREDLLIDYKQVESCMLSYREQGIFYLKNSDRGIYLVPEQFSEMDDDGKYVHIKHRYGSSGVVFNKSLPKTLNDPNWIAVMLSGLHQKSNSKTYSYYLSRFFPFSPGFTINRKVWVVQSESLFIMKAESAEEFEIMFFFLKNDVVSIQSFGGDIKYMSELIKDVGLICK